MLNNETIGIISVIIAFIGFFPYFMSCIKKETKPHMFSWLLWGITGFAVYFGQQEHDAGAGAWVVLAESVLCTAVGLYAMFYGERHFTKSDYISLAFAALGIGIFAFSSHAELALCALAAVDIIAFYPTVRKSWSNPYEEQMSVYALSTASLLLSCTAMDNYDFATLFNLVLVIVIQVGLIAMVMHRRFAMHAAEARAVPAYQQA